MDTAFEPVENSVRNEAAAHRQNMTIGMPMLVGAEEPRWLHQVQMLPSTRHGDVKETAFFLDLLRAADRHVRGDATIDDVEHEHGIPFLALGRMDRRQHEVILIEMRRTRLGAGGLRRVQGQLGQKAAACRIGSGNLL